MKPVVAPGNGDFESVNLAPRRTTVSAIEARYQTIREELDALLKHAVAISIALAGKPATHDGEWYAEAIFRKVVAHALTLARMLPAGLKPTTTGTSELWDLSSVCAVSRAIIEGYDALSYVAPHDIDETERRFRVLLWQLHDQERRMTMLELIGSSSPALPDIAADALRLREELITNPLFQGCSRMLPRTSGAKSNSETPRHFT
jgi:hypothetical protein